MSMNRYQGDSTAGGKRLGSSGAHKRIRLALKTRSIMLKPYVIREGERLDVLAGRHLGDGRLWWVIAICSGIGWSLQVPPGTRINIPINLREIKALI